MKILLIYLASVYWTIIKIRPHVIWSLMLMAAMINRVRNIGIFSIFLRRSLVILAIRLNLTQSFQLFLLTQLSN